MTWDDEEITGRVVWHDRDKLELPPLPRWRGYLPVVVTALCLFAIGAGIVLLTAAVMP